MRARNRREHRARRGRYFRRDLAGFADIERLLAADIVGERLSPDVAYDDAAADVIARSAAPRPQPGGGLRRRGLSIWPICSVAKMRRAQLETANSVMSVTAVLTAGL